MQPFPAPSAVSVILSNSTKIPGKHSSSARPGFHCDISGCRTISDLPKEALDYVHYLEAAVGCRIKYVSVGPDRDAYIKMF